MNIKDRINELEEKLGKTPKNKGTETELAKLKTQISILKKQELETKIKKTGTSKWGYTLRKKGDSTCVLVGNPCVGKSTILNKLTRANAKTAEYEFTTLNSQEAILKYNGAKIQIIDIPGILEGASTGTGRGKEVLCAARCADLLMIILDIKKYKSKNIIEKELYKSGIFVNKIQKKILIKKTLRGGINIKSICRQKLDKNTIAEIFRMHKIANAEIILFDETDIDDLNNAILKNRVYVPCIFVYNKIDTLNKIKLEKIKKEILNQDEKDNQNYIFISAQNQNLNDLKKLIFSKLNLIAIYTKKHNKDANLENPLILKKGATIYDACKKIHNDFLDNISFAKIWGSSKFDGQRVGLNYKLQNNDIVELCFKI